MLLKHPNYIGAGSTTQVTSTAAELNLLDGSAEKTVVNGKAVMVLGRSKRY